MAQVLAENGRKNAHPLYGGFNAWVEAGLPVEAKEQSGTEEGGKG